MSANASTRLLSDPRLNAATWLILTVLAGGIAGVAALRAPLLATAAFTLVVGIAFAALVVWRLEIGVIALLFTLPLDTYGRVPGLGGVTLYQLVLLVTLAAWGLQLMAHRRTIRFSWADVGMSAVILAALWSYPHSLNPGGTIFAIVRLLFTWAFMLLLTNAVVTEKELRRVVMAFLLTAVGAGLLAIAQQWLGVSFGAIKDYLALGGGVSFSRAGAFFADPNQLGTFMSIALIMAAALLVHEKSRRYALLWVAVGGVTGLALVASLSRTAWVGALLGLVIVVLTAPRDRRRAVIMWAAGIGVAVAIFGSPFLVARLLSVGDVSGDKSVATRYYMTQSTIAMIRDNPVWGTGLDAYPLAYPAYRLPGSSATIVELHQLPLAFPVEMGLAGVLAEIVLFTAMMAPFVRRRKRGWTVWESATFAALLGILVQTLFQYYLYFEYLWLVLALGVVASRLARASEEEIS
jgi:O-antigen ligase